MQISKQGLISNNPLDCLKLVYLMNKEKLREAFEKVKVQVQDEKDLEMMAKIVANKIDTTGQLRDPEDDARPLVFDCMRIINAMEFTEEEKQAALNPQNYI